jgi:hypothetical protein
MVLFLLLYLKLYGHFIRLSLIDRSSLLAPSLFPCMGFFVPPESVLVEKKALESVTSSYGQASLSIEGAV